MDDVMKKPLPAILISVAVFGVVFFIAAYAVGRGFKTGQKAVTAG